MKGLVAFSFGIAPKEPNPCNVRLANAVERIVCAEQEEVIVVAQKEIAFALSPYRVFVSHVVEAHREGKYLDSEEVMAQAAEAFRMYDVTGVIPVAHPFLHLTKCRALVRAHGFIPLTREIGQIGFCLESRTWWTRSPLHLVLYAILQKCFGYRGGSMK